uniref:Uncharacterized protein n=1 Tax=Xiphophorus maculatus TaxID=8083 RepID=A0A3B5QVP3_XIPMA
LSSTVTETLSVPDLGGFPPSFAVTNNTSFLCCSRSRGFFSTKNGILSSSFWLKSISK